MFQATYDITSCLTNTVLTERVNYVLTDNKNLNETSVEFQMPFITRSTIKSDGYGTRAYLGLKPQCSTYNQCQRTQLYGDPPS